MIESDREMQVTLDRITRFQALLAHLCQTEASPRNYHQAASGYLAEIDRMQLDVREYLETHPTEVEKAAA